MSFFSYLSATKAELRHVSWPTRTQAVQYTALVLAISIVTGVVLGVLDYSFRGALARAIESLIM